MNALNKSIPVHDILRYVLHRILEKEGISVAIERSWVSGLKLDRVHRVPKGEVRRIRRDLVQPRKQLLCVGNSPKKDSAGAKPARHILQHTVDF
jgi:hypothetical protein